MYVLEEKIKKKKRMHIPGQPLRESYLFDDESGKKTSLIPIVCT